MSIPDEGGGTRAIVCEFGEYDLAGWCLPELSRKGTRESGVSCAPPPINLPIFPHLFGILTAISHAATHLHPALAACSCGSSERIIWRCSPQ
jgi:hypothetical protein